MMTSISYIQFYPTLRCNLHCHFCFNKGLPPTNDVRVADFEKMVSVLKDVGVTSIDILGGEPTLHHALMELIDIIHRYRMQGNISSNGTNIPILNALSERYDKEFLRIGISLNTDALSEELHEYIIRHIPILKHVFTKKSIIPKTCEPYMGLSEIEYFLIYMDVIDHNDLAYSVPFYDFYRELTRLKKIYKGLDGVFCSGFISRKEDHVILKSVRCPAGTIKLSIFPDGSVYPCYLFSRYKEFELGNILRDDVKKIWQNPVLNYFRVFHENHCPNTGCGLWTTCHGGCPALSYIFHKNLDAPDPRCWD